MSVELSDTSPLGAGGLVIVVALVAAGVAHVGARIAAAAGPVHAPNARSSHDAPTPSGGGLGIAAGVAAGLILIAVLRPPELGATDAARLAALMLLLAGVAALGFFDDLYDWSPRLKLALLSAASVMTAFIAEPAYVLPLAGGVALGLAPWAALAGSSLWVFTVKNATNFMDGANGLAGGAVGVASAALAFASLLAGAYAAAFAAAALAGALAGFLPLNAPKARVFMGDAGSLFIGGWYAAAGLLFIHEAQLGAVYAPPLMLMPILGDTLLTMAWHVRHRAPVLQPHRNHAYQVRIASGASHAEVSLEIAMRAAALAALAFFALALGGVLGEPGWLLAAFIAGVGMSVWWWRRDHAPRRTPIAGR